VESVERAWKNADILSLSGMETVQSEGRAIKPRLFACKSNTSASCPEQLFVHTFNEKIQSSSNDGKFVLPTLVGLLRLRDVPLLGERCPKTNSVCHSTDKQRGTNLRRARTAGMNIR
jgi:hypothetical protein